MKHDDHVFIIILNYCSHEDTIGCIKAVRSIDYSYLSLLVIDNASPGDGVEKIREILTNQEFLRLKKNRGYSGGNNEGIRLALARGADFVLILNPDTRVPPDIVDVAIDIFRRDSRVGALNTIQLKADGKTIDEKFSQGVLVPAGITASQNDEVSFEILEVENLLGASLMLRGSALSRVGGFDPLFSSYGEESDLCRRLKFFGFLLVVSRRSPVVHLRTEEARRSIDDARLFLRLKGYWLFLLKDQRRSFVRCLLAVIPSVVKGVLGSRQTGYPFDEYPLGRGHAIRAAFWLVIRLPVILYHRRRDRVGGCYL
jgi:GT2 family glycosyltransferase